MLSYVPRGLDYLARLWPELCVLMALVGMFAWGVSFGGMLLVVLGMGGRLFWAVRGTRRFVKSLFHASDL
jgi:hypothetical protein